MRLQAVRSNTLEIIGSDRLGDPNVGSVPNICSKCMLNSHTTGSLHDVSGSVRRITAFLLREVIDSGIVGPRYQLVIGIAVRRLGLA